MADTERPVIVPHTELSEGALRGVVESFVLREGTDYGEREFSFEEKITHVIGRLENGGAQILFDPGSETVQIVIVSPDAKEDRF